jgi:hypothetical protein
MKKFGLSIITALSLGAVLAVYAGPAHAFTCVPSCTYSLGFGVLTPPLTLSANSVVNIDEDDHSSVLPRRKVAGRRDYI